MWQIKFSDEAASYAIDSHPYNEGVLMAIEDLAHTIDGVARVGRINYDASSGFYKWFVAQHMVAYEIISEEDQLYIWVIKPLK